MAHHFDHLHITSKEPPRSAKWWAEDLGATVLPEAGAAGMLFAPVSLDEVKITFSGPRPSAHGALGEPAVIPRCGLEHVG